MSQALAYGAPPRTRPSRVTMSVGTPTLRVPPFFGCPAAGFAAAGVAETAAGAGVADTAAVVAAGGACGPPLQAAMTPAPAPSANNCTTCRRVMTWAVWFRLGI